MNLSEFHNIKKILCLLTCLVICNFDLKAQLTISYINVDEWVQKNFGGQGIILGNIKHKGYPKAIAGFTSSKNALKLFNGLIISTGAATDAIGPNNSYNISTDFSYALDHDKDLKTIEKGDIYDLSYIEFDFVSFENSINFNYQFASDEYPEYVGSSFNDIFAFFVSDEKTTTNIAVIPGKNHPVSINTINSQNDSILYINNNVFANDISSVSIKNKTSNKAINVGKLWYNLKNALKKNKSNNDEYLPDNNLLKYVNEDLYNYLQYDGITQKLSAQTFVEPYKKYHLKIIIADVADNFYDSAVFLETNSFISRKDSINAKFKNYLDFHTIINPNMILQGQKLEEILPQKLSFALTDIYFDFDKSEINIEEIAKLNQVISVYNKVKDYYRIEITGNTDNIGSYEFNYNLSKKRCESVINFLKKNNPEFWIDEIDFNSYTQPKSNNKTEKGRKLNRRVSIQFIKIKKDG